MYVIYYNGGNPTFWLSIRGAYVADEESTLAIVTQLSSDQSDVFYSVPVIAVPIT